MKIEAVGPRGECFEGEVKYEGDLYSSKYKEAEKQRIDILAAFTRWCEMIEKTMGEEK